MHLAPYAFLLLALFCALGGAGAGVAQLWQNRTPDLPWVERAHAGVTLSLLAASGFLLHALATCNFSVRYAASYTDRALPLFYRITAFWAGQAGSLLFWALMVSVCGSLFAFSRAYRALSAETRLWFQTLFLTIMAFFALMLTTWNNPFQLLSPAPADGNGLNPLLRNPGMIIHPPLLFLGYGGFVVPGCLALAQALSGRLSSRPEDEPSWLDAARPFTMTAWLFLTAGIVIGGWWAYGELGWGGYWAWDPVENASLLPWLAATAALHTGLIQSRRGKLLRVNVFLMALTTVSAFFATYLVRGNVVDSVHSFGGGGVGPVLLIFVLAFLVLSLYAACRADNHDAPSLEGLETREGFLVMTAWALLAVAVIILAATLWPVLSALWSDSAMGLEATFYNRTCLPLFTVVIALLAVCPWLGWRGGIRDGRRLAAVLAVFVLALTGFWKAGVRQPLPLMAASLGSAALISVALALARRSPWRSGPTLAAGLVHLGLVLTALGIAFSGPYKTEVQTQIARGESVKVGPYTARLRELYEGRDAAGSYTFLEAELELTDDDGSPLGSVAPQRRIYAKFDQMAFSEAATRPSLGREFYATLLGVDGEQRAVLRLSSTPLVSWLWIGGAFMTLAPLLGLRRRPIPPSAEGR